MKAAVFSDKASCDAFAAKVDAAMLPTLGPPVNAGGGRHAPEKSINERWANAIEHPTQKGTFAYAVDDVDSAKLPGAEKTNVDTASALTSDWFPTAKPPASAVAEVETKP